MSAGFCAATLAAITATTDPLKLRLAYYKAIGRPSPSDLGTNETLNQTTLVLTRGNPDLRPRQAWNYDLSYEWFMGSGLIAVAAFAKDIRDEIFTSSQAGPITVFNGVTYRDVVVSTARNAAGARVKAFDPESMHEAGKMLSDVDFCDGPYHAIDGADAMVLITEWDQFRAIDFDRVKKLLKTPTVVDLRNVYQPSDMVKRGFNYVSVGRP